MQDSLASSSAAYPDAPFCFCYTIMICWRQGKEREDNWLAAINEQTCMAGDEFRVYVVQPKGCIHGKYMHSRVIKCDVMH